MELGSYDGTYTVGQHQKVAELELRQSQELRNSAHDGFLRR